MVLNVQDEIINGTPKYNITPNGDGTNSIELANEVIQEGTPINKALFDEIQKLNAIDIYNDVTGEYNPMTQKVEFEVETNTNNIVNNKRILISPTINIEAPADNYDVVKGATNIGSSFDSCALLKLSNGNFVLAGGNYSYDTGYFTIIDSNGNVIKSPTSLGNYFYDPQMIEMSNGNVMIVGSRSHGSITDVHNGYFSIIDKNGNIIKSSTLISSYMSKSNLLEMSNGNIIVVGGSNKMAIISKTGDIIKSATTLNGKYTEPKIIELNNNNIMIAGGDGDASYIILNQNGEIVKDNTSIKEGTSIYSIDAVKMNNNNIMITGHYYQGTYNTYYLIVDQNGNKLNSLTPIGTEMIYTETINLDNGNILFIGHDRSYYLKSIIVSQTGQIISQPVTLESNYGSHYSYKMSNGNVIVAGSDSDSYLRLLIVNQDGSLAISKTSIGRYFNDARIVELENKNIAIAGSNGSGTGYIYIIKPKSTNAAASLNGIDLDTMMQKDKYYELVYNQSLNKFIAEEVRNAN